MPGVVRADTDLGLWGTGLQILGDVEGKIQSRTREDGYELGVVLEGGFDLKLSFKHFFKNNISLCSPVWAETCGNSPAPAFQIPEREP